jgi:hypothetical protein
MKYGEVASYCEFRSLKPPCSEIQTCALISTDVQTVCNEGDLRINMIRVLDISFKKLHMDSNTENRSAVG